MKFIVQATFQMRGINLELVRPHAVSPWGHAIIGAQICPAPANKALALPHAGLSRDRDKARQCGVLPVASPRRGHSPTSH